jgi:hypothetical protein
MPLAPDAAFEKPREQMLGFGRRLQAARKRAGYGSQYALARRTALSPLTVHRHETGQQMPSRAVLEEYAWLLGVTPQHLLFGSDDPLLDLPPPVLDYVEKHRDTLTTETLDRLARIPWHVIADPSVLEGEDVHEVRIFVDRALRKRDAKGTVARPSSSDEAAQLPIRSFELRTQEPPRRGRPPTRQAATG